MISFAAKHRFLVYLLPLLHVFACLVALAMGLMGFESGRDYIALVDEPVSTVIVGLAWHYNLAPFLLFLVIGTLWWYLLSRAVVFVLLKVVSLRRKGHAT